MMDMDMWFWLSLSGAFFQAVQMAIKKKALQVGGMNNAIAFVTFLFAGVLFGAVLFLESGTLEFSVRDAERFWNGTLWTIALNAVAVYFLYRALEVAELSYLMPYMTLTSLTIAIPPIFLFHEFPSLQELIGIAVVVAGAIVMEKRSDAKREDNETRGENRKGLLYFLVTALCY
ncbi:MAG: DMT family transporter, partial [Nitrososphaera sp.]|nr:DMT family transporter [Nitrososphaera sp.]